MAIALVAVAAFSLGWWWWLRDEPFYAPYDPQAYPDLSVTINGRPLADEIPFAEHWLFVVLAEPPAEFPDETEFRGIILISSPDDINDLYADDVLWAHGPESQARIRGSVNGVLVDVAPPPLGPDDPRRQWVCVMHPHVESQEHPEWPRLAVGEPLTLRILLYAMDERGEQRVEDTVLVLEHDFTFVEADAD